MKGYKLFIISAITITLLAATTQAALEYVYTELYFNIGAVDELTVTLLGESTVTSSVGGTTTPAQIEFNVSGDATWQNATVSGGSTQDKTNPILSIDNTGTTDLVLNISINATMPSGTCTMLLRFINETSPYDLNALEPEANGEDVNTTNITIDSSFTPAEAAWGLWLYTNFSGCVDADDDIRRFFMWAETV